MDRERVQHFVAPFLAQQLNSFAALESLQKGCNFLHTRRSLSYIWSGPAQTLYHFRFVSMVPFSLAFVVVYVPVIFSKTPFTNTGNVSTARPSTVTSANSLSGVGKSRLNSIIVAP